MYRDLITYKLASGVTKAQLIEVAQKVVDGWKKKQPGFVSWEIAHDEDGHYMDIVFWETLDHAKHAEKEMANIPNVEEWFACYEPGSIKSKKVFVSAKF